MAFKDPSFDHLVDYIAGGDGSPRAWADMSLTVNLSGLTDEMAESARTALDLWEATAGFRFTEVSTRAEINFVDGSEGAYASLTWTETGEIASALINVDDNWMDYAPANQRWGVGDYGLQTFVHEIGHAVGLQHPGPYNGTGDFVDDAIFAKDTWQYSIMSYFDQSNTEEFSYFISGPRSADVSAIEQLYGPLDVRSGDSDYSLKSMGFTKFQGTYTLVDSGGVDLLDLSDGFVSDVDMRGGTFSSLGIHSDNFVIAKGSVVENALGGAGKDEIAGNAADNEIYGGQGGDRLSGRAGDDTLVGGSHGKHYLTGKAEGDTLIGGSGEDTFFFEKAKNALNDEVRDFASGTDIIDLSSIDANSDMKGNQSFDFIGSKKFTGDGGELRYTVDGGGTLLSGDIDGDRKADFEIMLNGKIAFRVDDFIL